MPHVLDEQENAVDANRHHRKEDHLKLRERRPLRGVREIRQHETQHRERQDHHEKCVRALQIVACS